MCDRWLYDRVTVLPSYRQTGSLFLHSDPLSFPSLHVLISLGSWFGPFRVRSLRLRGLHLPDVAGRVHLPLAFINFFQISNGASSNSLRCRSRERGKLGGCRSGNTYEMRVHVGSFHYPVTIRVTTSPPQILYLSALQLHTTFSITSWAARQGSSIDPWPHILWYGPKSAGTLSHLWQKRKWILTALPGSG